MIVLQLVMRDTGGPTVHKSATAETETEAVTLWQASATAKLVSLERTAIRVCYYRFFKKWLYFNFLTILTI